MPAKPRVWISIFAGIVIQQPQHYFLPVKRGQNRNPDVELVALMLEIDPSVLRQPFFSDVKVG